MDADEALHHPDSVGAEIASMEIGCSRVIEAPGLVWTSECRGLLYHVTQRRLGYRAKAGEKLRRAELKTVTMLLRSPWFNRS